MLSASGVTCNVNIAAGAVAATTGMLNSRLVDVARDGDERV